MNLTRNDKTHKSSLIHWTTYPWKLHWSDLGTKTGMGIGDKEKKAKFDNIIIKQVQVYNTLLSKVICTIQEWKLQILHFT